MEKETDRCGAGASDGNHKLRKRNYKIEEIKWKFLKRIFEKESMNINNQKRTEKKRILKEDQQEYGNWFTGIWYFWNKCVEQEDFFLTKPKIHLTFSKAWQLLIFINYFQFHFRIIERAKYMQNYIQKLRHWFYCYGTINNCTTGLYCVCVFIVVGSCSEHVASF